MSMLSVTTLSSRELTGRPMTSSEFAGQCATHRKGSVLYGGACVALLEVCMPLVEPEMVPF